MWCLTDFNSSWALRKSNWKFKILINGCYTGLDNIPDKRKELQEPRKVMICKLLQVIPALCNQVQQEKGAYQRLKILWTWLRSTVHMTQERFSNVTVLNPGRGTLGIIGWGSASPPPPGGACTWKIALKYKEKQSKNGKFTSNCKASPIDFETQISLRR